MSEKYKFVDVTGQIYDSATELQMAHELRLREELEQKQRELSDKNPEFIQLYKGVSPEIITNIAEDGAQGIKLLMFFMENMNNYNTLIVSQKTMSELTGLNDRAVRRAIKTLEKHGAIAVGKVGNANVYFINPQLAWQRKNSEKKYAVVKANVLFGRDEMDVINERFDEAVVRAKVEGKLKIPNKDMANVKIVKPTSKAVVTETNTNTQESNVTADIEQFESNAIDGQLTADDFLTDLEGSGFDRFELEDIPDDELFTGDDFEE